MVFSLGCLKKSLLALVAISLLVSVGQLVLIFINNKIFGALMFVMYILFFLAILLALCRDSVSMYAASAVLLIVFIMGCTLIQAYDVEVKDLLDLSKDEDKGGGDDATAAPTTKPPGRKKRHLMQQILESADQWKPQEPSTPWTPGEDRLPMYPANSQPVPVEFPPDQRQGQQYDQRVPSPPPQIAAPSLTVPEVPTVPEGVTPNVKAATPSDGDVRAPADEKEKPDKKYHWRNELRWCSNVLGILHILLLAVVICLLYEMLFGGRYRYRTWC